MTWRLWTGLGIALWLVAPALAQSDADRRCLQCHAQKRITTDSPEELSMRVKLAPGETLPPLRNQEALLVLPEHFKGSPHAAISCTGCHVDATELPHAPRLGAPQCNSCHSKQAQDVGISAHAAAAARGFKDAPRCFDCHGGHDIRPKHDKRSRTYPLNVIKVCGNCHQKHSGTAYAKTDGPVRVRAYLDSVHGQAISKAGLVVAATCADCHGHHDVRKAEDPESMVNRGRIARTCGGCHAGINEVFVGSVHHEAAVKAATQPGTRRKNMPRPPVCVDCHASHAISRADTPKFQRDIVNECGDCHAELYRLYRASYHGQVQELGSDRAARCSSCHGTHNIRRPDDPKSTIHPHNLANTCAQSGCHNELRKMSATANVNFIRYAPHSDYRNRHKDPILYYVWLYFLIIMSVTFTFWGVHSIAWFIRGWINRAREGPPPQHHHGQLVRRFGAWHRITHGFVIISFFGLTITGLPLKFSDQRWANAIMSVMGGPVWAGTMHRCFAVLVVLYMLMHVIHIVRLAVNRRAENKIPWTQHIFGPYSMLPTKRDWREFAQMTKWFFGMGPKPTFDRWTYWEKFDYWADAVGTGIIGGSGLLLWFPTFFSQFLSGYWFNIATVVHGYEALLAAGFIFTIHFFNAHIRWEKFPVDTVIFSGRLPEEEFREERGVQYERLAAEGRLEQIRVKPGAAWQLVLAKVVALLSLTVGSILVILIVWAGLSGRD